jgi:membrane protease YdiL (CAAX protease family)
MTSENHGYPAVQPPILPYASPPGVGGLTVSELYAQVLWFRRSTFNSKLVLLAMACWMLATVFLAFASSRPSRGVVAIPAVLLLGIAGMALLTVCVVVLTGPVYMPEALPNGRLRTWGRGNRFVAALFLVVWIIICIGVYRRHH